MKKFLVGVFLLPISTWALGSHPKQDDVVITLKSDNSTDAEARVEVSKSKCVIKEVIITRPGGSSFDSFNLTERHDMYLQQKDGTTFILISTKETDLGLAYFKFGIYDLKRCDGLNKP